MPDPTRWRIDRHIPIAVILTILLQSLAAIWWTAKLESRLEVVESYVTAHAGDGDRLIRIEEQLKYIAEAVSDMKQTKRR